MTITGTGFTGATAVDFGTAAGTIVTVGATTITAYSPAGTGTVDVTVTTPSGTSGISPADQFTYVDCADSLGRDPNLGPGGRRHFCDDHRDRLHRRHGGRLRHDAGDRRDGRQRHIDHGREPCGLRHGGRDRGRPGRQVGHLAGRSVYVHRRADGFGREPGHRSGGRRYVGDDHRDRLHRRHGGRLRHDAGDRRDGRQRHHDHGREPRGHRHGGRDRDGAGWDVGHLARGYVHLRAERFRASARRLVRSSAAPW